MTLLLSTLEAAAMTTSIQGLERRDPVKMRLQMRVVGFG
jgi:hypothetical protein